VSATAHDAEKLRQVDAGTRRAWKAYTERLRDLAGEEYEHAEHESWEQLQRELRRLDHRRKSVTRSSSQRA